MDYKISSKDNEYPQKLREMVKPPKFLYFRAPSGKAGEYLNSLLEAPVLAVIGSRAISDYGKKVVWDFIPRLASRGVIILSGLAEGVDSEAHAASLNVGGTTLGVVGFGLAYLPKFSNFKLAENIINSGAGGVLAPFESWQVPSNQTFILRNSIIAALCDAVLVIEATKKSGCFQVVESAMELNKAVLCVPGSVFAYNSCGTNELIKAGCNSALCIEDILNVLSLPKT